MSTASIIPVPDVWSADESGGDRFIYQDKKHGTIHDEKPSTGRRYRIEVTGHPNYLVQGDLAEKAFNKNVHDGWKIGVWIKYTVDDTADFVTNFELLSDSVTNVQRCSKDEFEREMDDLLAKQKDQFAWARAVERSAAKAAKKAKGK